MRRQRTLAVLTLCLLGGLLVGAHAAVTADETTSRAGTLAMSDDAFYTSAMAFLLDTGRGLWHRFWDYLAGATAQSQVQFSSPVSDDGGQQDAADTYKSVSFPESPDGATLVQFAPCSPRTSATIPMFVNEFWVKGDASVTSAYISQHGANSDFDAYYSFAYPLVGKDAVLVSPGLYYSSAKPAPRTWYQPTRNLAWSRGMGSWPIGGDASRPSSGAYRAKPSSKLVGCSSFDMFDAILARLADKSLFPRMATVYFVGHSGGANMVSRYAQLTELTDAYSSLHVRYVDMNAANHAYFDHARPWLATQKCSNAFSYPYQLTNEDDQMPRWVKQRFDGALSSGAGGNDADKANALLARWLTRDVVQVIGDRDTATSGTQGCASVAQGGSARRDRNYAFWAYENMLAGTTADVAQYFGYVNLTLTGVQRHATTAAVGGNFTHQVCVAAGVAHDAKAMLNSDCGRAALLQDTLPAGAGPSYPNREKTDTLQALLDDVLSS